MTSESKSLPIFGQRHVIALIVSLGNVVAYAMQVGLNVGLVAMVNNTGTKNVSDSSGCPIAMTNSSTINHASNGEFNWSRELQGYIISAVFWGSIIVQIPAGTLAQKHGAKWILGSAILWISILTVMTPLAARVNVYLLIALRFLEGAAHGVIFPSMVAMFGRWSPREETSSMISLASTGLSLGVIVGQLVAGILSDSTFLGGWPSIFYIFGGVGVLWSIAWCFLVYDSPEKHPRISLEEKNYILSSISTSQEEANKKAIPWKCILLSREVWSCIIAQSASRWISFTLITCLPQFLSDVLHFNIIDNGLVASAPYVCYIFSSNIFAWISDTSVSRGWFGKTTTRKFFSFISLAGSAACLLGVTFTSCNRVTVIVLLIFSKTLFGGSNAGYTSVLLDLSPEYCGLISGIANLIATASAIMTPIVTDNITVDKTVQEWNIVFYISACIAVIGLIQFLIFGSAERKDWDKNVNDTVYVVGNKETDHLITK